MRGSGGRYRSHDAQSSHVFQLICNACRVVRDEQRSLIRTAEYCGFPELQRNQHITTSR